MEENNIINLKRAYTMMILPCALLFVITLGMTAYFGFYYKGDSNMIYKGMGEIIPYLLIADEVILFIVLMIFMKKDKLTFRNIGYKFEKITVELVIGAVVGALLYFISYYVSDALSQISIFGNMISPKERFSTEGWVFFIGSITIAPFVEENIFRGYGTTQFESRYGKVAAVMITAFFFSLLHFAEGFTGIVNYFIIGIVLGILFLWRKNIAANFSAHAVVSLIMGITILLGK